ncbi:MAG: transcriptional regulator AlsR family [Firmicutes bacterium]|nr:transcriptional regulator AlsR family [Bacillota bacterium]
MEIRQLRYFLTVAKYMNFSKAAAELFITQPTISQQIVELEKEVGVKLFTRTTRKIKLTPAGLALQKEAKLIIAQIETAIAATRQADTTIAGRLSIGILGPSERRFSPKFLASFQKKYPQIELVLKQFHLGTLDIAFKNSEIDLGFTLRTPSFNDSAFYSSFFFKKIYTDRLCLITPYSSNEPGIKLQDYANLNNGALVFMHRNIGGRGLDDALRILADHGVKPSVSPTQNLATTLLSVESGMGVSLLPRHVPEAYSSPNLSFIDIEDTYIDICVAWKQLADNPLIRVFIAELEPIISTHKTNYA